MLPYFIGGVNNSKVPTYTYVNRFKCFYANTDTLLNKRLELSNSWTQPRCDRNNRNFDQKKRDIDPETQEFHIDGNDHHTNLEGRHKRGVILYTKSHCNATTSHIVGQEKFEECLWSDLKLKGADDLLIGVVYRTPKLQQGQPWSLEIVNAQWH